jgi:hypothetical protein
LGDIVIGDRENSNRGIDHHDRRGSIEELEVGGVSLDREISFWYRK